MFVILWGGTASAITAFVCGKYKFARQRVSSLQLRFFLYTCVSVEQNS